MHCILTIPTRMFLKGLVCASALLAAPGARANAAVCDANATFEQAKRLIGDKQFESAGKLLDRFRECPGLAPLESFQLGWLYGRARRFANALAVFQTVPHAVPDPLTHDYAVALSDFELGRYRESADVLKPYQQSGKADAKTVNLLAVSYSKLGLYRDAYDALSQQIRGSQPDIGAFLNLVTVCAEAGNFEAAAETAKRATELFPDSPDVWIAQGAAQTILGHLDQGFQDFSTAVKIAPARADARFFLALVDYKQAKFSDAIAVLQSALRQGIKDSDLHYLLAECLLKMDTKNSGEALAQLNQAIDLSANSVAARTLRGKLLLDSGHPEAAIRDLELAHLRDPHSQPALYNLARAYRADGRTAAAAALFREYRAASRDASSEMTDARLSQALTGEAGPGSQ